MTPLTPAERLLWDAACQEAAKARGLGFEALAQSSPLGRDGTRFAAACPHAALRLPCAELPAAKALALAFGLTSAQLELREPAPGQALSDSWAAREASRRESERAAEFAKFQTEPLARAFSEVLGARMHPETFKPGP